MEYTLDTKESPKTISVFVETQKPQRIHVIALDKSKRATIYTDRGGWVNGKRRFDLPLPTSPNKLTVIVYNEKSRGKKAKGAWWMKPDNTFKVAKLGMGRLKTWNLHMRGNTAEFMQFAQMFADNAGVLQTSSKPYQSNSGRFKILYLDGIKNRANGQVLSTPARISNKTGIIEISKPQFLKYSVAMRMIILMHEYSHCFLNADVRNEVQADLNALYYYCGKGYSPIEAHRAFLTVFSNADTAQNEMRYQMIKKYMEDFYAGKIVEPSVINQLKLAS